MGTCDTCKFRSGPWKAGYSRGRGPGYAYAECMYEPIPEWCADRGERPIIMPGAGTHCAKYIPRTAQGAPLPEPTTAATYSPTNARSGETK